MTKWLSSALLALAATLALGQNTSTYGTITAAGGSSCTARSCVYLQVPILGQTSVPGPAPWVTVNVSGTWSGALQVVSVTSPTATYQNLNAQSWTQIASITANGNWSIAAGPSTFLLVQAPTWASGSAQVTLTASPNGSPLQNPVFPGGLTGTGLTAPDGGSSSNCWLTNGSSQACGGSSSGVQYNPSDTVIAYAGDSSLGDDTHVQSSAITVTGINCNGTVCIFTATNSLAAGDWVDIQGITSPTFLNVGNAIATTNIDGSAASLYQVISSGLSGSQFEIAYTANTGTGTGGTAYTANNYLPFQIMKTPFFNGHGVPYVKTDTISALAGGDYTTYYQPISPAVTGKTGWFLFVNDQDVFFTGTCTLSTIEGYYSTLWTAAHAGGWKIVTATTKPGSQSTSVSACTNAIYFWQAVNDFIRASTCGGSSTSACTDAVVDLENSLGPGQTNSFMNAGHYLQAGSARAAALFNQAMGVQKDKLNGDTLLPNGSGFDLVAQANSGREFRVFSTGGWASQSPDFNIDTNSHRTTMALANLGSYCCTPGGNGDLAYVGNAHLYFDKNGTIVDLLSTGGFPITLGSTSIAAGSTTTGISNLNLTATGTQMISGYSLVSGGGIQAIAPLFPNVQASISTAATSSSNESYQNEFSLGAKYWTGSASSGDTWNMGNVLGTGANPTTTLSITHTGTTGTATVAVPALKDTGLASAGVQCVQADASGNLGLSGAACGSASGGTVVKQNSGSAETTLALTGFMPQFCSDTSGSGTAQSCTTANTFTPQTGNTIVYSTTTTNSGTGLTVNINSLGAKSVAVPGASGWTTTLTASQIPANKPLILSYDGTNWNVQQTGVSGSGGGTTVTAAPPYVTIGGISYDNDFYAVTKASSSPSWLNSVTPASVSAATNGNIIVSTNANANYWQTQTATTSVEVVGRGQTLVTSGTTSFPEWGAWLYDSTNGKIYLLAPGMVGATNTYALCASIWTYSGTGNPAFSSNAACVIGGGTGMSNYAHLKVVKVSSTVHYQISLDGGVTFTDIATQSAGTIAQGGYMISTSSTAAFTLNVLSEVVN